MRVLANIAEKVTAVADSVANGWLPSGGSGASRGAQRKLMRRFLLAGAAGSVVFPFAFVPFLGAAVGLPAGVGAALALSLLAAAATSLGGRSDSEMRDDVTGNASNLLENDSLEGRLVSGLLTFHDAAGDVTGISGRDKAAMLEKMGNLHGKGFVEQIHVSDRIAFLRAIDRLRLGDLQAEVEIRMAQTRGGRETQFLNFRTMMTAIQAADGSYAGFAAQSLDNTGQVTARIDAETLKREADSANEAKSRFLAAVSHELRTPLNAILGFSDILAGEYFGKLQNDRQREYVDLISQSGNHLLSVVNTMLDMSKIEAGHYEIQVEPFMIAETARACEAMLEHQALQKKVTLTFRVARNCGEVTADKHALKQILINLVGNAIKFTEEGGVVSVDFSVQNNALEIVVSDTGIGIPHEKIELLGKPFMQVQNEYSRKFEGTGLGLSLVKGLVSLHGGEFAIESELGEGTVITVRVPADGSGAENVRLNGLDKGAVEFPPRLHAAASEHIDNEVMDNAKAKSA